MQNTTRIQETNMRSFPQCPKNPQELTKLDSVTTYYEKHFKYTTFKKYLSTCMDFKQDKHLNRIGALNSLINLIYFMYTVMVYDPKKST